MGLDMFIDLEKNKEKFLNLVAENLSNKKGIDQFFNFLIGKTDFFEAPASSKFHLSVRGGLCQHSLNVYEILKDLCSIYYEECPHETIVIVSLFHDLCKANMYKETIKNVNKNGIWMKVTGYDIKEDFPIGHGEKSVIILQKYISLTDEEIYAIRWHMSGFDNAVKGGDYGLSNTFLKKESKLLTLLIAADLIASNIYEYED